RLIDRARLAADWLFVVQCTAVGHLAGERFHDGRWGRLDIMVVLVAIRAEKGYVDFLARQCAEHPFPDGSLFAASQRDLPPILELFGLEDTKRLGELGELASEAMHILSSR